MQLTFIHFELEYHSSCSYDYVKIFKDGNQIAKLCRLRVNVPHQNATTAPSSITPTYTSLGTEPWIFSALRSLTVVFSSDHMEQMSGFRAKYRKGTSIF